MLVCCTAFTGLSSFTVLSHGKKKNEGTGERVMMCYETIGEGRERKNPVQQNQPSNKHAPVMGLPKPKSCLSGTSPNSPFSMNSRFHPKLQFLTIKHGMTSGPSPTEQGHRSLLTWLFLVCVHLPCPSLSLVLRVCERLLSTQSGAQ